MTITGSKNNKDVYINQSYRKENGKTSSRIYKKLGKLNDLLMQFSGDQDKMMAWARAEAKKKLIFIISVMAKSRLIFLKEPASR